MALLEVLRGQTVVRKSGDAPTGDALVDHTFDNLERIDRFVRHELGRDSWDGKGSPMRAQLEAKLGRNATFSTTSSTILLGQRPGAPLALASFGHSPTIMGHEIGHGMQIAMGKWDNTNSSEASAVAESFADVMGTGADDTDWTIGDEVPGGEPMQGTDLRDLSNPPYKRLSDIPAFDSQPFSQLLSYAAVLVAKDIGKPAMRKLWYAAMERMPEVHSMKAFAAAVQAAAADVSPGTAAAAAQAYASIGI